MADYFSPARHGSVPRSLLPTFGLAGPVLAALLIATAHPQGVQRPPNDVVADPGKVLDAAAANEDDRVLLEGVPLAGDVCGHFYAAGQADPGHLTQGGVGLLGRLRAHVGAHAPLLGRA